MKRCTIGWICLVCMIALAGCGGEGGPGFNGARIERQKDAYVAHLYQKPAGGMLYDDQEKLREWEQRSASLLAEIVDSIPLAENVRPEDRQMLASLSAWLAERIMDMDTHGHSYRYDRDKPISVSVRFVAEMHKRASRSQGSERAKYEKYYMLCAKNLLEARGIWMDAAKRARVMNVLFIPETQELAQEFAGSVWGRAGNDSFDMIVLKLSEVEERGWLSSSTAMAEAFERKLAGQSQNEDFIWNFLAELEGFVPPGQEETLIRLVDAVPVNNDALIAVHLWAKGDPAELKVHGLRPMEENSRAIARYVERNVERFPPEAFQRQFAKSDKLKVNYGRDAFPVSKLSTGEEGLLVNSTFILSMNDISQYRYPGQGHITEGDNIRDMFDVVCASPCETSLEPSLSLFARYLVCFDYEYKSSNIVYGEADRLPAYILSGTLSVYDRSNGKQLGSMQVTLDDFPERISGGYRTVRNGFFPFLAAGESFYHEQSQACKAFIAEMVSSGDGP